MSLILHSISIFLTFSLRTSIFVRQALFISSYSYHFNIFILCLYFFFFKFKDLFFIVNLEVFDTSFYLLF